MVASEDHNKYIAWTFIGHGTFQLLIWVITMLFIGLIMLPDGGGPGGPPPGFMWTIFAFMFVFQSLFVIPSFVAAWGLLKHRSWSRTASIVAGVLAAMNVPVGTAACVYALWFFLGDRWKDLYGDAFNTQEVDRQQLVADMQTRWTGMHTDEKGEVTFRHVEPPDWR